MSNAYFIGIDIGTQGARVVIVDQEGRQLGAREEVFPLSEASREEQSPEMWWQCCRRLIPGLLQEVKNEIAPGTLKAMAVTSTSGTIIPLDHFCNPLHAALMYSDLRSGAEAAYCQSIAREVSQQGYTAFNASSGLPKMRWFLHHYPELVPQLYKFIHASDFITGRLCGDYTVTDYTNALKSGFNLHDYTWPDYLAKHIGIKQKWLQTVKPSGQLAGKLTTALTAEWGLPESIVVTTGMTDGCASQVASGAVTPGQWNTTIGTTLVIKGVTEQEVVDPGGAIYNHRHPSGYWMPGGASNTGADWVSQLFGSEDLHQLSVLAGAQLPGKYLAWPLLQKGERFPFVAPHAIGIWPEGGTVDRFTACMEGVGFIERYAYEKIMSLANEKVTSVYAAGGGSTNDTWLRIRSNIMNVPVCKMQNVSGAAGAAILAASSCYYSSLEEAARKMVHPASLIKPEPPLVKLYEEKYQLFISELLNRKII